MKPKIIHKVYAVYCYDCQDIVRRIPFLVKQSAEDLREFHKQLTAHKHYRLVRTELEY